MLVLASAVTMVFLFITTVVPVSDAGGVHGPWLRFGGDGLFLGVAALAAWQFSHGQVFGYGEDLVIDDMLVRQPRRSSSASAAAALSRHSRAAFGFLPIPGRNESAADRSASLSRSRTPSSVRPFRSESQ